MKKITGLTALMLMLLFIGIIILRVWDIHIFTLDTIVRSTATLILLGIAIVIFILIYGGFFRNNEHRYTNSTGNRAHPKQ